jgi:hypothetical protein
VSSGITIRGPRRKGRRRCALGWRRSAFEPTARNAVTVVGRLIRVRRPHMERHGGNLKSNPTAAVASASSTMDRSARASHCSGHVAQFCGSGDAVQHGEAVKRTRSRTRPAAGTSWRLRSIAFRAQEAHHHVKAEAISSRPMKSVIKSVRKQGRTCRTAPADQP